MVEHLSAQEWMKLCAKCRQVKPVSDFYNRPRRRTPFSSYCKQCIRAYNATPEHHAKVREATRRYRATPEGQAKRRAYQRQPDVRQKQVVATLRWRSTVRGRAMSKASKRRYERSPKGKAMYKRAVTKYLRTPKGKAKWDRANARRRTRLDAVATLTAEEWLTILETQNYTCKYCVISGVKLTQDHVIPLALGGTHTKDNVAAACLPCNLSKGKKTVEQWRGVTV